MVLVVYVLLLFCFLICINVSFTYLSPIQKGNITKFQHSSKTEKISVEKIKKTNITLPSLSTLHQQGAH